MGEVVLIAFLLLMALNLAVVAGTFFGHRNIIGGIIFLSLSVLVAIILAFQIFLLGFSFGSYDDEYYYQKPDESIRNNSEYQI